MGNMRGAHVTEKGKDIKLQSLPLYKGRGLEAPMVGTTVHKCGSQGRHK